MIPRQYCRIALDADGSLSSKQASPSFAQEGTRCHARPGTPPVDSLLGHDMLERTDRQHATVTAMIDIAERMAAATQRIARRDVMEVGDVELTDDEGARLAEALMHIETAAADLQRLRRTNSG